MSEQNEKKEIKWKKIAAIAGGATAAVVLTAYVSGIVYYHDRFLANTTINGIDVSYAHVDEIESQIQKLMQKYKMTLAERDGDTEEITAKDISLRYDSKGEVEGFQNAQNHALWFVNYFQGSSYEFEESYSYDTERLQDVVSALQCFDKSVEVAPTDAELVFESGKYNITEETQGKKVNKKKLLKVLTAALDSLQEEVSLEESDCYQKPEKTSDDEKMNLLMNNLNHYADISIAYQFGDQEEVLDGNTVKDWLTYDENTCKVLVKDGAITEYVAYLADKYDTYDKPREFTTADGSKVTVEGGSYGWQLDQAQEAVELTKLMEEEPHIKRTPLFAQTADSWENGDMGDTYIEIDLTKQHLWLFKEGELIIDTDFVSGKMTSERMTPPGTFQIRFKKSPAVLRSTKPGDSYESPVTFWMPFNGGVGLHDASWRGSFGGSIYVYSGSHGCINLPYSAAKTIYENVETGFPVICFYRNGENK